MSYASIEEEPVSSSPVQLISEDIPKEMEDEACLSLTSVTQKRRGTTFLRYLLDFTSISSEQLTQSRHSELGAPVKKLG